MIFHKKKPKYVFFDWDDTLVNTKVLSQKSFNELCEGLKMNHCFTLEEIIRINSINFEDFFKTFFKENAKHAIETYRNLYNKNQEILKVVDGAENLLKKLQQQNIYTGIISNKPHDILEKEVKKFRIDKYVNFCIGADFFKGVKKPNPLLYDLICKEKMLEKKLTETAFCGDSTIDIDFFINSKIENMIFLGKEKHIEEYLSKLPDDLRSKIIFSEGDFDLIQKLFA